MRYFGAYELTEGILYGRGGAGTFTLGVGLAMWVKGVGWALISFLTLVVALARLIRVFSRLMRQI
jgi:hypothetical protein